MTNNTINTGREVMQYKYTNTNTVFTIITRIPVDDTIPQNTEGTEILTLSITPVTTTSTLVIEFNLQFNTLNASSSGLTSALFQDATVGALAATYYRPEVGSLRECGGPGNFLYSMTSGTTSSTTFKIRCGVNTLGTGYINADGAGTRLMGGVSYATLSIIEYF